MIKNTTQYLKDYKTPDYTIEQVNLEFHLGEEKSLVTTTSTIRQLTPGAILCLDGDNLTLMSVAINGQVLNAGQYEVDEQSLTIVDLPSTFELSVVTQLNPSENTQLEGLYVSDGAFCTQCEAQGFRRITFYLDRPDVMAVFTTKVIADKVKYPYLLSNGNQIDSGELANGLHYATWYDPHKKPAYLFALVAGDFDLLQGEFVTKSGRNVSLQFFVDKGNAAKAHHAMASLKKAMRWDEERFDLEYDLDIYMVVAVDFFNMGAMENKGLNVFNSKYVLADNDSATDLDFHGIESVIGHEYFHNWTGNRITCRDWFQLSLKEGLTVFRDQEFSSDVGSRAVNRIDAVKIMRSHQFSEDAGPMAHPIRPEAVMEMNNFYTVTVYNKGAEVIRMIHTLLGEQRFQQGMKHYINKFDGMAVTCEDFIVAMEQGGGIDLKQFRHWYSQAGTPTVSVQQEFEQSTSRLTLTLSQSCAITPDNSPKEAFHIPVALELINKDGSLVQFDGKSNTLLQLTKDSQRFVFDNIKPGVVPCLLGDFSAPVKLNFTYSNQQLAHILTYSANDYSRWDSAQRLLTQAIVSNYNVTEMVVSDVVLNSFSRILQNVEQDPALIALMLDVPSVMELFELADEIDVDAVLKAREFVKSRLAQALCEQLNATYQLCQQQIITSDCDAKKVALRSLKNATLGLLATQTNQTVNELLLGQFKQASNMTDSISALSQAHLNQQDCAALLLKGFEQRWSANGLVMDKWFAVIASQPSNKVIENINKTFEHSSFSWHNPNRVRSLLGAFCGNNASQFHAIDGSGYAFLVDQLIHLNDINPQIAARLITPLLKWQKIKGQRKKLMKIQLQRLAKQPNLAKDLVEKVSLSLG